MAFIPISSYSKEGSVLHFFDEIRDEEGYDLDPVVFYNRVQSTQYENMAEIFSCPGLVLSTPFAKVDPVVIAIMMNRLARAFTDAREALFLKSKTFFVPLNEVNAAMKEVLKQYEEPHPDLLIVDAAIDLPST